MSPNKGILVVDLLQVRQHQPIEAPAESNRVMFLILIVIGNNGSAVKRDPKTAQLQQFLYNMSFG
jgi:hypothetical protein